MGLAPVICIPHGGGLYPCFLRPKLSVLIVVFTGPMPVLGDPGHDDIVHSWKTRLRQILKLGTPDAPRVIVAVTAHWSEDNPTISSAQHHDL